MVLEASTMCTVYAGPQSRVVSPSADDGAGASMRMSGMCPPLGTPRRTRASESSQVEKWASGARAGSCWESMALSDSDMAAVVRASVPVTRAVGISRQ